jgi:mono/diheme cytochrome c family protein
VTRLGALPLALVLAGACASGAPFTRANAPVVVVRTEAAAALEGEPVLAAADDGTRRLLLTAQAAWILRGTTAERTAGARRWSKAALIPAADGRGTWAVGLDRDGRLWRVRPGADLEEISDRYGLDRERIHDLCATGGRLVAFLLEGTVAVADGRRVLRFATPGARAVVGGGRQLALVFPDRIETLDLGTPDAPARRSYRIRAIGAGIDARGTLHAATARAVYRADGPTLRLVYAASDRIRWLSAAGPRAWFADGGALLALDDGVAVAQGAQSPADDPVAAGDGGLWLIDHGRPTRVIPSQSTAAEERWAQLVRPIFTSSCAECHRPDGKSGVDLSTASAWLGARDEIRERVVVRHTMPPTGRAMSEEDRATIAAWVRGS